MTVRGGSMNCESWRELTTAYIEGALDAAERREFEAHLQSCPHCAGELTSFRATVAAVRALPPVPPPVGLLERINAARDAPAAAAAAVAGPARRLSWQQMGALAVAACALVGFVAVFRHGLVTPDTMPPAPPPTALATRIADEPVEEPDAQPVPAADEAMLAHAEEATPTDPPPTDAPESAARERAPGEREVAFRRDVRPRPRPRAGPPAPAEPAPRPDPPALAPSAPDTRAEAVPAPPARVEPPAAPAAPSPAAPPVREGPAVARSAAPRPAPVGAAAVAPEGRVLTYGAESLDVAAPAPRMAAAERAARDQDGGVQVVFVPPDTRQVGKSTVAAIVLTSETDASGVVVRATPGDGMRVENADASGVLYRGDLRSQRRTTVAARVVATRAGTHQLRIAVVSDTPAVTADVEVEIPGFRPGRAPEMTAADAEAEHGRDVSLVFSETDIREALRAVADRGRVRVDIGPGIGGRPVSAYFQRVPAEAALRILADEAGYELRRDNGVFSVTAR